LQGEKTYTAALRAADSLVLPLNTTQYAIELKYYLAKVQDIAESSQLQLEGSLNVTNLADAIHELAAASLVLDNQTLADMDKLHKLLPPPPHGDHGHDHPHHDCPKKQIKQFLLKICSAMGSSRCERKLKKDHSPHRPHHGHEGGPPRLPKKKVAEIKKVLESIRAGNKKRQAFEGGFISEEGIKVCFR
jgi:N-acetylated-alpha-linked acidic dipeptidase